MDGGVEMYLIATQPGSKPKADKFLFIYTYKQEKQCHWCSTLPKCHATNRYIRVIGACIQQSLSRFLYDQQFPSYKLMISVECNHFETVISKWIIFLELSPDPPYDFSMYPNHWNCQNISPNLTFKFYNLIFKLKIRVIPSTEEFWYWRLIRNVMWGNLTVLLKLTLRH